MPFKFGAGSEKELQGVHPRLVDVFRRAIAISDQDFTLHDGLRTEAEQRKLVDAGASQTMNSLHRKQQKTGFGHAGDAVPYINGKVRWEWPAIFVIAVAMRKALDAHNAANPKLPPLVIRWGGAWRDLSKIEPTVEAMKKAVEDYGAARRKAGKSAFTDGPHYEIVGGV